MKNFIISFTSAIIGIWVSQAIIFWILGFFPENVYLSDSILYFYPLILTIGLPIYFFVQNKKSIARGLLFGGIIYCVGLGFVIILNTGELNCTPYFFNLLNKC